MTSNGFGPASPGTDASTVAGLARELEQLRRQMRELCALSGRVDQLAAALAELADTVAFTRQPAGEPRPCWLDYPHEPGCDPATSSAADDAAKMLATLARWVAEIYLRYADAVRGLPDCWMRHPDVVEELLWLRHAWLAAYEAGSPSTAVGDWHDRQRPGVVARIRAAVGTCSLDAHRPGADSHAPAPAAHAADAVEAIAGWWVTGRDYPAPAPTEQQLTAALVRYRSARL